MPEISVIVPHYNDLDALNACLNSLEKQTLERDRFEIVVCDNNSPLPPDRIAQVTGSRAQLVSESEKGAGPARNRAVTETQGKTLAFIDSDCIAEPEWLENGLIRLTDADIVGGKVRVFSLADKPTGADLFEQIFAFDQKTYVEEKGFSVTANLFCARSTFDAVGPFRNGVSEDLEWCMRARRLGFGIAYADDAVVAHPSRPDWQSLRKKWERLTHETYALVRQEGTSTASWQMRQLAVAASALPHSAKVLSTSLSTSEKLRVLGTLWKIRLWRAAEGLKISLSR